MSKQGLTYHVRKLPGLETLCEGYLIYPEVLQGLSECYQCFERERFPAVAGGSSVDSGTVGRYSEGCSGNAEDL